MKNSYMTKCILISKASKRISVMPLSNDYENEEARDKRKEWVMYEYLNNRVQVTKVGSYYSEILDIIFGVSQGSILGSLLFKLSWPFFDRT